MYCHVRMVDVQWVIESYGLFLSALILVGGALGDSLGNVRSVQLKARAEIRPTMTKKKNDKHFKGVY